MSLAAQLTPDQSEQLIYQTFLSYGIPDTLAKLATAQSGHETSGWTSNVFLNDNNAFGYGYNGSSYTQYNSVEASVNDLVGYFARRVTDGSFPPLDQITTADQYAGLLKAAGYYTDSETNYAAGLVRWFNDNLTAVVAGSGLFLIFGLLLLFLLEK